LFLSGKCLWIIDKNYNNNNNTCKQLLWMLDIENLPF
jgi:hypothetical protein